MHKLMSMPAIDEDETSSGDDDQVGEIKRKVKKSIPKAVKRQNSVKLKGNKHHLIEEGDEDEEEQELIKTQSKGVRNFFRDLFSCTRRAKHENAHSRLK